jgi:phage tail tape-measure protein
MKMNHAMRYASAISLALVLSTSYAADDKKTTSNDPSMTGKEKATAIGATTGAVAGAVVGGPVGAVVGGVVGGVVGNQGTDANGRVTSTDGATRVSSSNQDGTVRNAQAALNQQGYSVGSVDGQWGPNTQSAVRQFQADRGLTQSGTLDAATLAALGVNR